ncbi:MAG: Fe-S cluster assembly protein SufD [Saprospirales bacterium]|nr:MAG: Fe-S cluster assembly protein SufD [Saprospirales bacterium]
MIPKYQTEIPGHFKDLIEDLNNSLNGEKSKAFHQLRVKGGENLEKTGFPTTRNEDYKYTSFARVFNKEYVIPQQDAITQEDKDQCTAQFKKDIGGDRLCFINGIYQPELSNVTQAGLSVHVLDQMNEADQLHNEAINLWEQLLNESNNSFLQLNAGLSKNGLVIEIQKGKEIAKPLQLLFYYNSSAHALITNPQLLFLARENSRITVMEQHVCNGSGEKPTVFANIAERVHVEKYASFNHFKIQETSLEDFIIHNMIASQNANSHFYSLTADLGGRIVRNNLEVHLKESNTNTEMFGLFIGKDDQHIDNQTFLDHAIPHCESKEWYKGVLAGKSRGVFNGKVLVRQDAQKTNAFQQNNTLISGSNARMDSKPQLEIYADDVKCSHGATIGHLEENTLFYLMSRGLNIDEAGRLVKIAFLAEVFESVDNDLIKNLLTEKVQYQLDKV